MKPFLSPFAFLFAETVNAQLQCLSCFKKVHPWVFGAKYLITKILILFYWSSSYPHKRCMKVYKKYSYHISKLTVPSIINFKSFTILFSETSCLFNFITHSTSTTLLPYCIINNLKVISRRFSDISEFSNISDFFYKVC